MTASTLQHTPLPYSGHGGFVAAAVEVVREAIDDDALPVVLAEPGEIAQVRKTVGAARDEVLGFDMSVAGRNPARLLPALRHFLDDHPGRQLACISEPVKAEVPSAVLREVELHELLIGLPVLHTWNFRLICAYDTEALPGPVVDMMADAHADHSTDPLSKVERARAEPLPPRPMHSEELGVDMTTLGALRGFIQGRAQRAGLDEERVDDLVYAVNEVVTNSICHGEGRARVSFWTEDSSVICEVRDRGFIRDPLAGRVAPRSDRQSGRGLWLVNQLCDLVQLRSSPAGTTLRLYIEA
ncbi:MAG TPA: anti-sigma factor RsbA family regulatory protein [Jatrophihabitantaceae bacterium]|jgi:anti-sigma regulatory factor (Ser/Thr protein kinase)